MMLAKKQKVRNYSFTSSRRLPVEKMTELNGVRVPSMPGSCYHAIICSLASQKDCFCYWEKLYTLIERYMRQYAGADAWAKFKNKKGKQDYKERIRENTHTLTRTGKDCYGYRLHEQGMCIYYFRDGAMLITGGTLVRTKNGYNVVFNDGKKLQSRYRGTVMTYKEYRRFLESEYIDASGNVLDKNAIQEDKYKNHEHQVKVDKRRSDRKKITVCITLADSYNQDTANRLEMLGFVVEQAVDNEIIGSILMYKLSELEQDRDVIDVEVSG